MQYTKKTLKNGLRIITVPVKGNPTVSVMAFVETGSNYETEKTNGLSHFLEHMFFKGTETRTLHDISESFDGIGAVNNAFTSEECTAYWAKAHYKHRNKLIESIADMYLNSTFPKEEIEKERGVIIEEINMYEDLPQRKVYDVLQHVMYGEQPAGRPIIGPKTNIKNFSRKDFLSYRKKHYVAEKTIIVVAGKIDEKEVQKEVTQAFKDIPTHKGGTKKHIQEKQTTPAVEIHKKKTDQTHFVLGFRAPDAKSKKGAATEMLSAILGKGMSSRLFKKMRDELGICYYVRAGFDASTDHGVFMISAGVNNARFEEALTAIAGLITEIKEEKVTEKELTKAKEYLLGSTALSLESSDAWAQFYAFQEILEGKIKTLPDIIKEIKKVTADDIQKMAKEIFTPENTNLAVVGNVTKTKKIENILNNL
tara:strand:- start:194 stop:1462 length:1269 start_codon:yes stop_codon:yes gene_type:complete